MNVNKQSKPDRRKGSVLTFKKVQNPAAYSGTLIVCLSSGLLPLIDAFPTIIRYGFFAIGFALFLLGTMKNGRFMVHFAVTMTLEVVINLFAYFNTYGEYYIFRRFMIRSSECWIIMTMAYYYLKNEDKIAKKKLSTAILVISTITAITSIIAIHQYPNMEIVRALANSNGGFSKEFVHMLYLKNVSTWGLCYAIVFLIPIIAAEFKARKNKGLLVIIAILSMFVLGAQITFAILFLIVFLLFLLITPPKSNRFVLLIFAGMLLFILLLPLIAEILLFLFNYLEKYEGTNVIRSRIWGLYRTFADGKAYGDSKVRLDLYFISINTFLNNPLFGGSGIGQHSQIFDLLGSVGIMGFTPMVIMFIFYTKEVYNALKLELMKRYFFLSLLVFLFLMFMNPIFYSPIIFMSIFLFPVVMDGK